MEDTPSNSADRFAIPTRSDESQDEGHTSSHDSVVEDVNVPLPDSLIRSRELLRALNEHAMASDVAAVMQTVSTRIGQRRLATGVPETHQTSVPHSSRRQSIAAFVRRHVPSNRSIAGFALVLAVIAGGVSGTLLQSYRERTTTVAQTSVFREYATRNGQRATVDLADGTQVLLNVGSRIRIPRTFGTQQRVVHLDGEAQFTVTHDPARPFVVYAQGTVVKDLATVFTVRAFPGEARTNVYVAAGAVAVNAASVLTASRAVLQAGDLATVTAGQTLHVDRDVNPSRAMSWVYGRLVFDDVPVQEVLVDLGRWFGVEITLTDPSLGARRISTRISEHTTSAEALNDIADILDARIIRNGNTVTVAPRLPSSPLKQ